MITLPPCEPAGQSEAVRDIFARLTPNGGIESLVDALSVRNYQRREVSGHDQFFATFERFTAATFGRRGDMVAEVSSRAASQNILYLELMQSLGMFEVAALAQTNGDLEANYGARIDHAAVDAIVADVIVQMDRIDARRRAIQGCDAVSAEQQGGCQVTVRYLSQVIRTLSPIQVYAQTLLAFKLIAADDRVVGLNFVAPEDHAVALRDYRRHMAFIAEIGSHFPRSGPASHCMRENSLSVWCHRSIWAGTSTQPYKQPERNVSDTVSISPTRQTWKLYFRPWPPRRFWWRLISPVTMSF